MRRRSFIAAFRNFCLLSPWMAAASRTAIRHPQEVLEPGIHTSHEFTTLCNLDTPSRAPPAPCVAGALSARTPAHRAEASRCEREPNFTQQVLAVLGLLTCELRACAPTGLVGLRALVLLLALGVALRQGREGVPLPHLCP